MQAGIFKCPLSGHGKGNPALDVSDVFQYPYVVQRDPLSCKIKCIFLIKGNPSGACDYLVLSRHNPHRVQYDPGTVDLCGHREIVDFLKAEINPFPRKKDLSLWVSDTPQDAAFKSYHSRVSIDCVLKENSAVIYCKADFRVRKIPAGVLIKDFCRACCMQI